MADRAHTSTDDAGLASWQAGFGVLEAGSVRIKNTRNILLKNLLDACAAHPATRPAIAALGDARALPPPLRLRARRFLPWRGRCVGAFIWWAWGHGTAYPHGTQGHPSDGDGNPFIGLPGAATGASGWVGSDESANGADFASWWFQCTLLPARPTPAPPPPHPRVHPRVHPCAYPRLGRAAP